jgi:hypothetical protein
MAMDARAGGALFSNSFAKAIKNNRFPLLGNSARI